MNQPTRTLDVQLFIDGERFSPCQWLILTLCFLAFAADGFDNAAIGYIAPALIRDWGVARDALGSVMSAALLGVGIGALAAGPLADRVGRKTVLVLSIACIGVWSLAAAQAHTIGVLLMFRFLTGLGLGAAMPTGITLTSEYAPERIRGVVVNSMICGFSCGMVIGGAASAWLIPHAGWKSVLIAGGVGPCLIALLVAVALPESAQFLAVRQGTHARIARILKRIAPQQQFDNCRFVASQRGEPARGAALALVLSRRYLPRTLLLWAAYFLTLVVYYLLVNWMPTLFHDAGFDASRSALVTSLFPLGGVIGTVITGWLMDRFDANRTITFAYVLAALLVFIVGRSVGSAPVFFGVLIFLCGMVLTSAATSTSAYPARVYPTQARATGVAWVLGVGRTGAVAGAFLGGELLTLGWRAADVFGLLAAPTLLAGGAVYAVSICLSHARGEEEPTTAAVKHS
ncbi:AAHS family 4-hydroxybenzoate transporter-like MFS transporter [Paraburkholderia sp. HC6.4b]|uniref:MFS transporter n=1 Tax=unclassified Paraburkholderia TaxID=2615204 RepID=UPI001617B8A8|nr:MULTISPECIES: MFS transporter [unclassified Paraburkholderia]MBB5406341.1 AAHS family 4-hydroxybenzoate transporter-like MFS transporter [Paraburkholderia sp. HC6.4b]MBB5448739.1 AAHS family 4-hydroxybenzoate transporter-like MFS transporter [Paraburkholderia sp. Kb1A]